MDKITKKYNTKKTHSLMYKEDDFMPRSNFKFTPEKLPNPDEQENKIFEYLVGTYVRDAAVFRNPTYENEKPEKESESTEIEKNYGNVNTPVADKSQREINTRPLSKHAETYELEKFQRNALLIFNHIDVFGHDTRLGTEKDVAALTSTFEKIGFEVEVEHELKKEQIMEKLKEFSSRDFTDYGCVAVAVLTHGTKNGLIMAEDMMYSELEIINHLLTHRNLTLVTKPRMVIIQACRGRMSIKGVTVGTRCGIQKDLVKYGEVYTLPVESDMLVLHSAYIGKAAMRDPKLGSWFIQSLCKKIDELSTITDFESILTEVKREVAIDCYEIEWNENTLAYDINKQMPVSTSTLTRKLFLKKFAEIGTYSGT